MDKNIKTAKVGYCKNNDIYSVYGGQSNGPVFGLSDLYVHYNYPDTWHSRPHSYPNIDGMPTGDFEIDDYEVFQVIKK